MSPDVWSVSMLSFEYREHNTEISFIVKMTPVILYSNQCAAGKTFKPTLDRQALKTPNPDLNLR